MNAQMKFKFLTTVANSKASESQKKFLETYSDTLSDASLLKLVVVFREEPRAVAVYADYVKSLEEQARPISSEKLEEILTRSLEELS